MNRPEIVSVGVVWDSERPSLEHIMDVFATVGTSLRLSDVFHSVVDSRWGASTVHNLVGVVTYYGKHYSTFFFHTKLKVSVNYPTISIISCFYKRANVTPNMLHGLFNSIGMDLLRRCYRQGNWTTVGTSRGKVQERSLSASAAAIRNARRYSSEYRERPEDCYPFPEW